MFEGLPERCYCLLPGNDQLIMVRRGGQGYYPVTQGKNYVYGEEARKLMNELNAAAGVTEAQREAMQNGSMFGWDVPAADPKTWEKILAEKQ